jgi:hypothetical protein
MASRLSLEQVRIVYPLVHADDSTVETRILELFQWRVERLSMIAKGFAGTSVSFGTALLVLLFNGELKVCWCFFVLGFLGAVLAATPGLYAIDQLKQMQAQYVACVALLRRLGLRRP